MKLSQEHYKRAFAGFYPYDCVVVDRGTIGFVLFKNGKKDTGDRRLVRYVMGVEPTVSGRNYTGFAIPSLVSSSAGEIVMIASNGAVAVLGNSLNGMQQSIPMAPDGPLISMSAGATKIDDVVFAYGGWRGVCFRAANDHWVSIRHNLPNPIKGKETSAGFDGVHGFSKNDMYGVGGRGDVWRFDGQKWHQCAVPTNMLLESVCCAGDGYVYIGMQSGNLMRGRENEWEVIHEDTMTLPFKDMVWFDNKLWCTSDYGVWTVENGKLKEADVPPEVKSCAGNLSAADGVLLLAGHYGAAFYDGSRWERLF
jgi:hypothetical protein